MKYIIYFLILTSSLTLTAQDVNVSLTLEDRDCVPSQRLSGPYFIVPLCHIDASAGGLGAFDSECQRVASANGRSGTWVFLANGGGRTVSDLDGGSVTMTNLMGQNLGITYQDLIDVPPGNAIPQGTFYEVMANGQVYSDARWGCPNPSNDNYNCTMHLLIGTPTNHCNEWGNPAYTGPNSGPYWISDPEFMQDGSNEIAWANCRTSSTPPPSWDFYDGKSPVGVTFLSCSNGGGGSPDNHIMCVQVF